MGDNTYSKRECAQVLFQALVGVIERNWFPFRRQSVEFEEFCPFAIVVCSCMETSIHARTSPAISGVQAKWKEKNNSGFAVTVEEHNVGNGMYSSESGCPRFHAKRGPIPE